MNTLFYLPIERCLAVNKTKENIVWELLGLQFEKKTLHSYHINAAKYISLLFVL